MTDKVDLHGLECIKRAAYIPDDSKPLEFALRVQPMSYPDGYPVANTYADLPSSNLYTNLIYFVLTTDGGKDAGLYKYDGANWVYCSGVGTDGAAGADGNTILSGVVAPTNEGVNGDFYINTATSTIYGPKAGGVWPAGVSLIGPAGTFPDQNANIVYSGPSSGAAAAPAFRSLVSDDIPSLAAAKISDFSSTVSNNTDVITGASLIYQMLGDGSDGDVTINANTTLDRDYFYNNLTINSAKTVTGYSCRITVKNTFTNNGTVKNQGSSPNGNNASGAASGSAGNAAPVGAWAASGGGSAGPAGGTGAGATAGSPTGTPASQGGSGGASGKGGNGSGGSGGASGAGGNAGYSPWRWTSISMLRATVAYGGGAGGRGGSSGGGDGANSGGGGGGFIIIYYCTMTAIGTTAVNGGTGGSAGSGVGTGTAGDPGVNGGNGELKYYNLKTGAWT